MKNLLILGAACSGLLTTLDAAFAQSTAFTYQGRLMDGGNPATGNYDLRFSLYDAATGGNLQGGALTNAATAVNGGLFTVLLDFGGGVFSGANRWLETAVRTNGAAAFTTLTPRQPLTPSPYAISAASVVSNGLAAGAYTAALSFSNPGNSFTGNGGGLTGLNASQLTTGTVPAAVLANAWKISGNAATTPGVSFLGTTDNQALELKVNGARALRLEPTTNGPNVIGGSSSNLVAAGNYGVTIGGGTSNLVLSNCASATIAGGTNNIIQTNAYQSTIGGGGDNLIETNSYNATIGGGGSNDVGFDAAYSTIAGGEFNIAGGYASTVPGGSGNAADGDYSFAAGFNANATNNGAFVWADSQPFEFFSTNDNEFAVRATGGARIVSAVGTNGLVKAGVQLAAGGGSWASLSDREAKTNFSPVDGQELLRKLVALPITTWSYRTQAPVIRHIGPVAQDFARAFAVGEDDTHITATDAEGVALAAVQGLNEKLEAALRQKEDQIRQLQQSLKELQAQVNRLAPPR